MDINSAAAYYILLFLTIGKWSMKVLHSIDITTSFKCNNIATHVVKGSVGGARAKKQSEILSICWTFCPVY